MSSLLINVITGETTTIEDGVAPALTAQDVRNERDSKLQSEVDVIASNALRWADLSSEAQAAWATYRTALLDVPQQSGFPDVTWPTAPE
tara:strand:- start:12 stop:278 length:267 start_codon:yes stop_codon:yes gene_type:complete